MIEVRLDRKALRALENLEGQTFKFTYQGMRDVVLEPHRARAKPQAKRDDS